MKPSKFSHGSLSVNEDLGPTNFAGCRIALTERKQDLESLAAELKERQETYQKTRRLAEAKRKEAEDEAPIEDEKGNKLPLKEELDELEPETLQEVEVALEDAESKANSIDANPEVVRRYKVQKAEMQKLEVQLEDVADDKNSRQQDLDLLRKRWENGLETHIAQICSLFSAYMKEMDCTGAVELWRGSESNKGPTDCRGDFKNWGIHILVSFREGCKAEVLSAHRHSGGERSVSTIMYLMAMQNLMVSPWRCVGKLERYP